MTFPTRAYLPGIGQVRIADYHYNDYFTVIDSRDMSRFVHRDRLEFRR